MVEYINKEEAYRTLNSLYNDLDSLYEEDPELWVDGFIGIAIGKIDDIPAADVAPVRHGHWEDSYDGITPFCSVCGRSHHTVVRTPKYCPNCGAKMDEERTFKDEVDRR